MLILAQSWEHEQSEWKAWRENIPKSTNKARMEAQNIFWERTSTGRRQAAEKSGSGRVERGESRKTSVDNSSQCVAAEQLPAFTTGIPSSGLRAGNRNAPAINAVRRRTGKNPCSLQKLQPFHRSALIQPPSHVGSPKRGGLKVVRCFFKLTYTQGSVAKKPCWKSQKSIFFLIFSHIHLVDQVFLILCKS